MSTEESTKVTHTGRPYKLNAQVTKIVCDAIRAGSFEVNAAPLAGIHPTTYWRYKRLGEKAELAEDPSPDVAELRAFYREVTLAIAFARLRAENIVFKDNPLAWLTKGPGKADWSDCRVEVTGKNGGPIELGTGMIDPSKLDTEELYALKRILEKCNTGSTDGGVEENEQGVGASESA